MDNLIGYLIAAVLTVGTAVGIYLKGKREGKSVEQKKTLEADLKVERKQNEISDKANEVRKDVDTADSDAVMRRLHDKYSRD